MIVLDTNVVSALMHRIPAALSRLRMSEPVDVVLCSHVLEHIPDDRQAMRELRRVLKPDGWALLQVPIDRKRAVTFEDPSVTDPAERARLFGQHDHVRWYGQDYPARLRECGFDVRIDRFMGELTADEVRCFGLGNGEEMHFCRRDPGWQGAAAG